MSVLSSRIVYIIAYRYSNVYVCVRQISFLLWIISDFGFDTAANGFQQNSYSAVGASSASSYEVDGSASFSASPELTGRQSAFEAGNSSYDFIGNGQNLSADAFTSASSFNATSGNEQSSAATKYAVNAQGLFHDPNPRIIRRPAPENARQYVQRVLVKFLQPPPLPPPGVSDQAVSK